MFLSLWPAPCPPSSYLCSTTCFLCPNLWELNDSVFLFIRGELLPLSQVGIEPTLSCFHNLPSTSELSCLDWTSSSGFLWGEDDPHFGKNYFQRSAQRSGFELLMIGSLNQSLFHYTTGAFLTQMFLWCFSLWVLKLFASRTEPATFGFEGPPTTEWPTQRLLWWSVLQACLLPFWLCSFKKKINK